jgi:hypothetical protein
MRSLVASAVGPTAGGPWSTDSAATSWSPPPTSTEGPRFRGRGEWAVPFGRVLPVARTFVSLAEGQANISVTRFVALTAVGVAVWRTLFTSIVTRWEPAGNRSHEHLAPSSHVPHAINKQPHDGCRARRSTPNARRSQAGDNVTPATLP